MAELVEATGGVRTARWLRREVAEPVEATGGGRKARWLRREVAELVEATGGGRKARWLRREVAELVEATGAGCKARWLRREVAEPVEATGGGRVGEVAELVEATGGLRDVRWLSLSKPPGPQRLPVPSTGSGTSVTAGPGPFDRLRDLCHHGSRSLRQAQGPLPHGIRPSTMEAGAAPSALGIRAVFRDLAALSDWLERWIRREKHASPSSSLRRYRSRDAPPGSRMPRLRLPSR